MTGEVKRYLAETEKLLNADAPERNWEELAAEMLIRIGFYQHERLVHLIVTVSFAVMTMISFAISMSADNMWFLALSGLFLVLDVPYTKHYYFLENSVQKLYCLYYAARKKIM